MWSSCPDIMKYSPSVWDGSMTSHDIWFLLRFYLDYLFSSFLIFRFNARQDQSPESVELLLSAAKDVLSIVLVFNEQRELMREVRSDFSAVVSPIPPPRLPVSSISPVNFSVPAVRPPLRRHPGSRATVPPLVLHPGPSFRPRPEWSASTGPSRGHSRTYHLRLVPELDAGPRGKQLRVQPAGTGQALADLGPDHRSTTQLAATIW